MVWSRTDERTTRAGSAKGKNAMISDELLFDSHLRQEASSTSFSAPSHSPAPAPRLVTPIAVIMKSSLREWWLPGSRALPRCSRKTVSSSPMATTEHANRQ